MGTKDYKAIILKNAEEIINTQGIKCLTISKIVQQSKISNRNFYECFSSKDELLEEIKRCCKIGKIPDERQTILVKAEEGIALYGFNNITLETIAKSAGLKRGSIYKHFSDKYELLECCIEYQFNKTKQIISAVYQENAEHPEDFLRKHVENYTYFLNNSYESSLYTEAWSHFNYRRRIRELSFDLQEHLRRYMILCLKTGMEQGIFKKDLDLETVTDFMLMTLNGMAFYLSKELRGGRITKKSADMILNTIFWLIRAEK